MGEIFNRKKVEKFKDLAGIREEMATIKSRLHEPEYRNNHDVAIKLELMKLVTGDLIKMPDSPGIALPKHPLHEQRLKETEQFLRSMKKKHISFSVGDSLVDLSRREMEGKLDVIANASGSWSNHIQQMLKDTVPLLEKSGTQVHTLYIGTCAGNPMLAGQKYQIALQDALDTYKLGRKLHPLARIVIYGFPPVYSPHASAHSYDFDQRMVEWCLQDRYSVPISLKKFGSGPFNLSPNTKLGSDGVHLTPRGATRLADAFVRARSVVPGTLILP